MAEAFVGKWKVDLSSTTGLEDFGAAIGFSQERIETYKKLSYTVDFSGSGDAFTVSVTFDAPGVPAQSYSFKLGQQFDYQSIDGTKPKLTITMEGGNFVESYELGGKAWKTVRSIAGNQMTSTTTFDGKSVCQKLNKA